MATIIKLFSILFVVFCVVQSAHAVVVCSTKSDPAPVDTETMTDFIVNFDDLPIDVGTWFIQPYNITLDTLTLTIYGPDCKIANYYGMGNGNWNGGKAWVPNDDGSTPGKFLGLGQQEGAYCQFTFSEPISAFSIRAASYYLWDAGVFIYDESDQEINCKQFPTLTDVTDNTYSIRGFNTSTTNNIKKILIKDSYAAADILRGTFCSGGKSLIDGKCQFPDPCILDPYPCGSNTNCSNNEGAPLCTCLEYYEGDASNGCTPFTCASPIPGKACNEHASCSELDDEPFFNCTCNDGFTGNGFGVDGCVSIVPVSPPGTTTPGTGAPGTPSAAPGKKVSAGSSLMASLAQVVLLTCSIVAVIA